MKKIFFRLSIWWFIFLLIPLTFMALGLYMMIASNLDFASLYYWAGIITFLGFTLYLVLNCFSWITLDKEEARITGDLSPKDQRIQYKCSVRYEDIMGLDLILSSNDSRNKKIKLAWLSSSIPKSYIEIKTKRGTERFCVTAFSNRQKKKIVNEIKKRCEEIGNKIEAEDTEVMYQRYRESKKKALWKGPKEDTV